MRRFALVAMVFAFIAMGCAKNVPPPEFSDTKEAEKYSYQGPIDPAEFVEWDMVDTIPINTPLGLLYDCYVRNPDPDASIQYANPILTQLGIVAYYFLYDGIFYEYEYNSETNCFEQRTIPPDILPLVKDDFKEYFGIECN